MVQVTEISPSAVPDTLIDEHDSDYEDVSDSGEEIEGMEGKGSLINGKGGIFRFLPSSSWFTNLWSRMGRLTFVAGNIAWIFTTSILLVGLPVLFAYDRERNLVEQQLGSLVPPPAPSK